MEAEQIIEPYQNKVIPLYLKKSNIANRILEKLGKTNANVSGIVLHMKDWKVTASKEISEIEELNGYLDSWLSPSVVELQTLAKKDNQAMELIKELQTIDQSLAELRLKLLKSSFSSPVAKN